MTSYVFSIVINISKTIDKVYLSTILLVTNVNEMSLSTLFYTVWNILDTSDIDPQISSKVLISKRLLIF